MDEHGYVLAVGIYPDPDLALTDLRDLTNPGPNAESIAGAGVLTRGLRGATLQQGGGGSTAYGIGTGAAAGLLAGYWIPLPLVGVAAGALIGGLVGHRLKTREERALEALLEVDLPLSFSALVCVVPEEHQGVVRSGMTRATKTTGRVLDDPAARKLARGLVRGNPVATSALGGMD